MTKQRQIRWSGVLLASTVLSGVGVTTNAAAQETSTGIGEIVITAQKREENLQDVPISVQAFGEQQLEELNISDFDDYARLLPSLSFTTLGPGFARVYFRGVSSGENGNHSASLPSVGTYLDEQPITTITGNLDLHLYDINRVEALAGPQGTLYGASSQAGTVRIITNQPDPEAYSSSYNVEVNSVDNGGIGYLGEAHVNIPLSESAAVRLVAWQEHAAGYIDNVPGSITFPSSNITMTNDGAVQDDYNDVDTWGARAALRVDLNENWTVTPSVMGQQQDSNGIFGFDPRVGDLEVSHFFPENASDRWVQAALTVEGRVGSFDVTYAGAYLNRAVDYQQDYTDYAYFYDALAGYGAYFYDDVGNLINPAQYIDASDRYRRESHEFRVASPAENRLRVVGGIFYQRQVHEIHQQYLVNGDLTAPFEVPGYTDTIWLTEQDRIDRDAAVFGEVSFDFTDRLTGTLGLRAFSSRNSLEGFFGYSDGFSGSTGVSQCFSPVQLRGAPCTNLDKVVEENGLTHRVNLTYDISDDVMIYGTYSTGFRPGGINRRGNLPPYDSDFLTNYELGWKTLLADGRLRFNGAVFFEQWEDFQYSLLGQNGLTEIRNAGNADIYGVEADGQWLVTDNFELSGAASWLHSETTTDLCNADPVTFLPDCVTGLLSPSGTELPVTPEFKANVTGRYTFSFNNWDAFLQTTLAYQSEVYNDLRIFHPPPNGNPGERGLIGDSDGYMTANFSTGIDMPTWSLSLYVNNATDERGEMARYAECATFTCASDQAGIPGAVYIVPIQPRTIGVRFGQRF
ncbi:MAG: TonB-dependent receptor [Hyphomonadaceae bacterium]